MDFIERLRAKPDHVRKQIAFGAASGITGLVALMWGTAFIASGTLARTVPSEAPDVTSVLAESGSNSLLGAIGALTTREDGSITVVDTSASSSAKVQTTEQRTVIPF